MTKKICHIILYLGLCTSSLLSQTSVRIGDSIRNSDGSIGVVFWINSAKTEGYMVALNDILDNSSNPRRLLWGIIEIPVPGMDILNGTNNNNRFLHALYDTCDGYFNTRSMRDATGCPSSPRYAACFVGINDEWFIPSVRTWNLLYTAFPFIQGKFNLETMANATYWTSSQYSAFEAWTIRWDGEIVPFTKSTELRIRAVRKFPIAPTIQYDTTLSYRWNTGDTVVSFWTKFTKDSTFSVVATSAEGCVSTRDRRFFVSGIEREALYDTICAGYSYQRNGFFITAMENSKVGNVEHTRILSSGNCSTIVTLHLTVKRNDTTFVIDSFCQGKGYVYNSVVYNAPGEYVQFLTPKHQCDSILFLQLYHKYPKYTEESVEARNYYIWNNQYYRTSGVFTQTFRANNGCDSVMQKTITICHTTHGWLTLDSCDQITYDGKTYFDSITFYDTLINAAGCDSILFVRLNVIKPNFDTVRLSGCDSVEYRGRFYYSSTIIDTVIELEMCRSFETAFLTVNNSYFNTQEEFGTDSLEYHSKVFYRDTVLVLKYQTVFGCDSIEEVHIFVIPSPCVPTRGWLTLDSCEQITYNNVIYFNDTIIFDTLVNADINGCDSILTVILTIIRPPDHEVHFTDCDSVYYRGRFYHLSTVVDTTIRVGLCVSLETAFLTVNHSYFNTENKFGKDSLEYLSRVFYRDTILNLQYKTIFGCDSIEQRIITICHTTWGIIELDSCVQITYDGKVYVNDTVLEFVLQNIAGCDSLLIVVLTVNNSHFNKDEKFGTDSLEHLSIVFYRDTILILQHQTVFGCDSIEEVHIFITQSPPICQTTYGWLDLDSCNQITYNGQVFVDDTVLIYTLENVEGCDSILTVTLTVNYSHFDMQELFGTDSLEFLSTVFYRDTMLILQHQTIFGCDSIEEIHISITQSPPICQTTYGWLNLDSCNQITYDGTVFFNDTTLEYILVNIGGCDSLLTVILTVIKSDFDTVHFTGCDSVHYRGRFFYSSTVVDTLIELTKCRAFETAFLTVNYSFFDKQELFGTDSLRYLSTVFYRDTILTLSHQTIFGCDSITEVHIFIDSTPPPPIEAKIVVYWDRVLAVANPKNLDELRYAKYYWYKDDVLLPQSNKDWIEVGHPIPYGRYNVSIRYQNREILVLERVFDKPSQVSVSPNPLNILEELSISTESDQIRRIEIFDAKGTLYHLPIRKTLTGYTIAGFRTSGLYVLRIYLNDQTVETVKIVVK